MAGADPIVVVGGGIGGLTAAVAIQQAGRDTVVLEREGDRREVGAGLTLWPNAMASLDRLGLGTAVRAASASGRDTVTCTDDGTVLQRFPARRSEERLGGSFHVVHRSDLLAVLAEAIAGDVVRLHTEVTAVHANDDGTATVTTRAHGSVDGSGAVGADGAGSAVAAWMCPDVRPVYAGWTAWRGIARFDPDRMPGPPDAETWGPDGLRFGAFALTGDRMYWYATANRPEAERTGSPAEEHALLVRQFGGWHAPVPAILAATDTASVLRNDAYDRGPLPSWVNGAVCLLGDAAHPMQPNLGQGACQAIEDAEVLGACLAAEASIPVAFARYEAVRKHHAEAVVALARRIGRVAQYGGRFKTVRDRAVRLAPTALMRRSLASFAAATTGPRGL